MIIDDYKNVTKSDFKKYMKATGGEKCYMIDTCKKSGLSPNKFIYIADNLDYFIRKFGGKKNVD